MKQRGRVICTKEMENAYRIVIVKCEGTRALRKLSHMWDDVKIYFKETTCEIGCCENGNKFSGFTNYGEFRD
jgi:hypothetical protein